jgi:hypothetical protein
MAVTVKTGATFEADAPRTLFQTELDVTAVRQSYAVSADGQLSNCLHFIDYAKSLTSKDGLSRPYRRPH